ncbi:hypothetical protein, partial [Escherichia coli]|uniref:hypothetical protein n=1 Tax=Escherichia coli TaxID=562 RepID=UPI001BC83E93
SRNSFRNWDWHYTFYSPYFIKLTGRGNYVNAEGTETSHHGINKRGNQQYRQPDKTVWYYLIAVMR